VTRVAPGSEPPGAQLACRLRSVELRFDRRNDFDDGLIKLMGDAFDEACRELHDKGQPPIVQEVLTKRIFDAMRRGERDPKRLRDAALSAIQPDLSHSR
jgi:hypothetical protein